MKHISEFIVIKREQLERSHQLSLFAGQREKGSVEWDAFNSIRDDVIPGYSVRIPKKPIVMTEPHHVLRIVYPPRFARGM